MLNHQYCFTLAGNIQPRKKGKKGGIAPATVCAMDEIGYRLMRTQIDFWTEDNQSRRKHKSSQHLRTSTSACLIKRRRCAGWISIDVLPNLFARRMSSSPCIYRNREHRHFVSSLDHLLASFFCHNIRNLECRRDRLSLLFSDESK